MKTLLRYIKQHPRFYRFLRYDIYARLRSIGRTRVFESIYKNNLWDGVLSVSGPGSSLEATDRIRTALPDLIVELRARSFLDIPCGDFQWMKDTSLRIEEYIGADIVHELVKKNQTEFGCPGRKFIRLDLLSDALPSTDILMCRDCMVHLSFREIKRALASIENAHPTYLAITTFPYHKTNEDTVTPYWRALNFQIEPFCFPEPIKLVSDCADTQEYDIGKHLGVWRFKDLGQALDRMFGRPAKSVAKWR